MTNATIAVVGDDGLSARIDQLVDDMQPRPRVRGLAHLDEVPALEPAPDVVVLGPSVLDRPGLRLVTALHDRLPGPAYVLVAGADLRAPSRTLVRTGAVDLLREPLGARDLVVALERAIEIGLGRRRATPAGSATPPRSRVLTVASANGGCGKTFYAVNTAYFLANHAKRSVCVVDLDLQFGEVSTALRLRPEATIFDLVRAELSDDELGEQLADCVVRHESGINVLAAPRDPSEADHVTPRDAVRVIKALQTRFDDVVVDTPGSLSEVVLAAFDLSDELVVMVTPDVPSVRNLNVFLQTLAKLKVSSDHVRVVMNKADRNLGIDLNEVERLLGRQFHAVLPYAREVSRSINTGTPVMAYAPDSDVARRLCAGVLSSLPEDLRATIDESRLSGRSRRRFGLSLFRSRADVPGQTVRSLTA